MEMKPTFEIKNALIKSTFLGTEDHGLMTFFIHLDYGGSGQSAGGYCLDTPITDRNGKFIKRIGTDSGLSIIMDLLALLEVDSWEKLPGTHVRVKSTYNKVIAIGHLLKDKWISFDTYWLEFNRMKNSIAPPEFPKDRDEKYTNPI